MVGYGYLVLIDHGDRLVVIGDGDRLVLMMIGWW